MDVIVKNMTALMVSGPRIHSHLQSQTAISPGHMNRPKKISPKSFGAMLSFDIQKNIYSPGERLPSESALGKQYGFSRPTVHKNIEMLVNPGVLQRRGRFLYVSQHAIQRMESSSPKGKIIIITQTHNYSNPTFCNIFELLIRSLGPAYTFEFLIVEGDNYHVVDKIDGASVVVMLGMEFMGEIYEGICRKCHNIFVVNEEVSTGNWILPDNYAAGQMMAEMLYKKGHRNIAIVMYPQDTMEFQERLCGARDYLARRRLNLRRLEHSDFIEPRCLVEQYISQFAVSRRVTALISTRYVTTTLCYDLLMRHGMEVPRDCSIVGFDDIYGCDIMSPPVSTVRYPTLRIAEKLIAAIQQAFKSPKGAVLLREKVKPVSVERSSVADITES